jgi:hypothetical protein
MQAHHRYLATALTCLLLVVTFTTGCGHSSQTASTAAHSSTSSSRPAGDSNANPSTPKAAVAKFRTSASAICQTINGELESSKPSSTSVAELIRFTPRHVAIERAGLAKLEALQAPSSLSTTWQQMIGYRKQLLSQLAELAHDAQISDRARIKQLTASKLKLHTELQKAGAQLDSAACGKLG